MPVEADEGGDDIEVEVEDEGVSLDSVCEATKEEAY